MQTVKNTVLEGPHNKPILLDYQYKAQEQKQPLVIFCHGYKGYKDWGAWDLVMDAFAQANTIFVKFNFSHNGGTVDQPIDFPDLEAFGNNNFTKELDDLEAVIDWCLQKAPFATSIDPKQVTLIGHSRGGGIVTIKAAENHKITKVITWAGVSDYGSRFPTGEALAFWEKQGVSYIENSRTKQQMPHYFQFYKDFAANQERLRIQRAVKAMPQALLVCHGTEDPTVLLAEAELLHQWANNSTLFTLDTDHVFGAKQPWKQDTMPEALEKVVAESIGFVQTK